MKKLQEMTLLSERPEDFEVIRLIPEALRTKWKKQFANESASEELFWIFLGMIVAMIAIPSSADDLGIAWDRTPWLLVGCFLLTMVLDWFLRRRRKRLNAELFWAIQAEQNATGGKAGE